MLLSPSPSDRFKLRFQTRNLSLAGPRPHVTPLPTGGPLLATAPRACAVRPANGDGSPGATSRLGKRASNRASREQEREGMRERWDRLLLLASPSDQVIRSGIRHASPARGTRPAEGGTFFGRDLIFCCHRYRQTMM